MPHPLFVSFLLIAYYKDEYGVVGIHDRLHIKVKAELS